MKYFCLLICSIQCLISYDLSANLISNGNFESCSFDHWQQSTDGFGELNVGTDFEIIQTSDGCKAKINIGYYSNPSDSNSWLTAALFDNILFYEFDLSGDLNLLNKTLSFDWEILIEQEEPTYSPALFSVGLFDGNGYLDENGQSGFLIDEVPINQNQIGNSSFKLNLDTQNISQLFLDFRLLEGEFEDYVGASLLIDNVSLVNVSASPTSSLFALSGLWLYLRVRKKRVDFK